MESIKLVIFKMSPSLWKKVQASEFNELSGMYTSIYVRYVITIDNIFK